MNSNSPVPAADTLLNQLTDYVLDYTPVNPEAYGTARYCLIDSMGCALRSLDDADCRRVLGPLVDDITITGGIRIPGLAHELEPVQAAFNLGSMIRWLDFNDTWLAAEWGHPSDNLGGILAAALLMEKRRHRVSLRDVLTAMIKAYEIQGCLALDNSFNQFGLDHVILVRVATTLVTSTMLGASRQQVFNALSNAWVDGGSLRCYRHAPDTGSRKSWAAGDATARGLWLALLAMRDETGYPHALSTPGWGFQDSLLHGQALTLTQPLDSYVMQNILFKVAFPAEFHAQTAVEAAIRLHAVAGERCNDIKHIVIETQQAGMRIINKTGTLNNPADRDHCLQYMVAIALLQGSLTSADYHDSRAADPRIDRLRDCMEVIENPEFTRAYHDPSRRAIPGAVQIFFGDDSRSERIAVEFPLGHPQRRGEALPLLHEKFIDNTRGHLARDCCEQILALPGDGERFDAMPVGDFMHLLHSQPADR
ncbi:MAG: bifunctional 2-methylcitrate dehydratase/aconitate hydratase [Thiohalobacterales bacterium]